MADSDSDSESPPNAGCKIMTFRPTMEEFKDFNKYLVYMESQGAHRAGLAKVIPPKGWKPKSHYDDIDDLIIPSPIQQMVTGQSGLFTQYNIQKKPVTVQEFRRLANSDKYCTPRYMDYEDLERKYWKNLTFVAPIYGADVNGSLYDKDINEWNISHLNTILDVVGEDCGISIEGVNTPYLYFGMWKTTFAWHTEDMDLYSINYLHFGEPKSWYTVPPEHGKRLERLAQGFFPNSSQGCEAFLRHKMTLISPSVLKKYSIPFDKVTQEAGEFMITFPYGYHAGFNHGFNCAESTNFASVRWIDYGKMSKLCSCSNDMVQISMDIFVRKFQPEKYQLWKEGKDVYTIDHTKPTPDTTPELKAWQQRRKKTKSRKSTQNNRSHSKMCTTTKGKKCTIIPSTEILSTEASSNGLTSGEPSLKVKLEDTDVLQFEEKSHIQVQQKDKLLDNSHTTGNGGSESLLSNISEAQSVETEEKGTSTEVQRIKTEDKQIAPEIHKIKTEETDMMDCIQAFPILQEVSDSLFAPASCEKLENVVKSEEDSRQPVSCQRTNGCILSEAQHYEKEESSSDSSEEDCSDLDVTDGDLDTEKAVKEEVERRHTCKSWRNPLSKPPSSAHFNLCKQQTQCKEEPLDIYIKEEASEIETEAWAKPLVYLWQKRPCNFIAEREYNSSVAKLEPYCAICTLLLPYYRSDIYNEEIQSYWETISDGIFPANQKTKPLIPEKCFAYPAKVQRKQTHSMKESGTSRLMSCTKCCVQVHASCYGIPSSEILDGWKCYRCRTGEWTAECCLCNLRGGALKQTTDKKWAHVMCAVTHPEVRFHNLAERSLIDTSRIDCERFKLKCVFCRRRMASYYKPCVQCSCGLCPTSFHVTCAHAAGMFIKSSDKPPVLHMTCFRHKNNQHVRTNVDKKAISVDQTVIAKHRNTRYYSCKVINVTPQTFYEIVFDDGSFSNDTFPEDIVSRDCLKQGPPAEGEVVQVKWPDGELYGAKYLGNNIVQMYQVEFEDGSQIVTAREEIYTLEEELPKRIRARYSRASDMKFVDTFYGEEIIQGQRKRQRVLNGRFKDEFVDNPGYRTFLRSSFQKT
ncbi:lysine-specific demethylase 4C isoform X2 [Ambystoma mexicanum]|uniref:lysine-specific demethylase 4C isoform X2 n=1 Tax=Ambystoma mexicanum TaxID=8296 RepID=UPI0037E90FE4